MTEIQVADYTSQQADEFKEQYGHEADPETMCVSCCESQYPHWGTQGDLVEGSRWNDDVLEPFKGYLCEQCASDMEDKVWL